MPAPEGSVVFLNAYAQLSPNAAAMLGHPLNRPDLALIQPTCERMPPSATHLRIRLMRRPFEPTRISR